MLCFLRLRVLLAILLFGSLPLAASGQEQPEPQFPNFANAGYAGTEFYFSFPPAFEQAGGSGNGLIIYVSSPYETDVTVEVGGIGVVRSKRTIANDVIMFKLSPAEGQPFNKSGNQPAPSTEIYEGQAVHVTSDLPILVNAATRFRFTSDAAAIPPVAALGREYVISSYADMSSLYPGFNLPSETVITAAYDNTEVEFTLGGNPFTILTNGMKSGESKSFLLDAGDVLAFASNGGEANLSGSFVKATRPVSVISGNQCANVPTNIRWCDFIMSQEFSVDTWGRHYHVGKISGRDQSGWIKVYAKEANTTVYLNERVLGIISQGGGGQEGVGFIHRQVETGPASSNTIWADKPIYVVFYNPGQELDGGTTDPFQTSLQPVSQYQKEIWFHIPGTSITNFTQNWANLMFPVDENGVVPDDLEFARFNGGQWQWQRVKDLYGSAPGDLLADGPESDEHYAMKTLVLPGIGAYRFRCSKPIGVLIHGAQDFDTYGMTPYARAWNIELPDAEAPQAQWTQGCGGEVIDAVVSDPGDKDAKSNLSIVRLIPENSFNYTLEVRDFFVGIDSTTSWSLEVQDLNEAARAQLLFVDRSGNRSLEVIEYFPVDVSVSEQRVDFGTVHRGTSPELTLRITNHSVGAPFVVSRLELAEQPGAFELLDPPALPFSLAAFSDEGTDHFLDLRIRLNADEIGEFSDRLVFADDCDFRQFTDITAVVEASIILASEIDFGRVAIGESAEGSVEIRNAGTLPLNISGIIDLGSEVFELFYPTELQNLPFALPPGQFITIPLRFSPKAEQRYSHRIEVESGAGEDTDNIIELDGEGFEIINSVSASERQAFEIIAGRPNPVRDECLIEFSLQQAGHLSVMLYDALGRPLGLVLSEYREAGVQTMTIDLSDVADGQYYFRFGFGGFTAWQVLTKIR